MMIGGRTEIGDQDQGLTLTESQLLRMSPLEKITDTNTKED
jgi:hypothetical protein